MSNDRVLSVDNGGVITAFVEHTHIDSKDIGEVYSTGHSTFIRADDHEMIIVKLEIRDIFDQSLQELVCGEKVIKALLLMAMC